MPPTITGLPKKVGRVVYLNGHPHKLGIVTGELDSIRVEVYWVDSEGYRNHFTGELRDFDRIVQDAEAKAARFRKLHTDAKERLK